MFTGIQSFADPWPEWQGSIRIIVRDRRGRFLPGTRVVKNLIVDAGLNLLRDALSGAVTDAQIKYVAVGTSATAPANTDTQLGAESFRKAVTSRSNGASAGQAITTMYLSPQDANIAIAEIGWFAGKNAGSGANTGVLVARVLYSHTHTNTESITIQRTDTL